MKNFVNVLVGITFLAGLGGCAPNYSNGQRAGVVTKFSKKGFIFKSWEGELLMTVPGMVQAEKFTFNGEESAVPKIQAALSSGKRVDLTYHQWALKPFYIDSQYVVIDVN